MALLPIPRQPVVGADTMQTRRPQFSIEEKKQMKIAMEKHLYSEIVDLRFEPDAWPKFPIPKRKITDNPKLQGTFNFFPSDTRYVSLSVASESPGSRRNDKKKESVPELQLNYKPATGRGTLPSRFKSSLHAVLGGKPGLHRHAMRWYLDNQADENRVAIDFKWQKGIEELLDGQTQRSLATTPRWKSVKKIGEGGYGSVTLFQLQEPTEFRTLAQKRRRHPVPGKVVVQVVDKAAQLLQAVVKTTDWHSFFEDYCAEAHFTSRVNATGCKNVVRFLGLLPCPEQAVHRIAYEFCPHGALYNLMEFYTKERESITLPEAFLWHIFHSMANAVCYNAYGSAKREERPHRWSPIIHHDLKGPNILIDEPDPKMRNLYPTLKLCDYGLAWSFANKDIISFKRSEWSQSTPGIMAPEVNDRIRSDPKQAPYSLPSISSDVYSIGRLMARLLRIPYLRKAKDMADVNRILDLKMEFSYEFYPYTRLLVDLALQCTNKDARKRPEIQELVNITGMNAAARYSTIASAASDPGLGGSYAGQVLYSKELQDAFQNEKDQSFKSAVIARDWLTTNKPQLDKIKNALGPVGRDRAPPAGHIATGHGLGAPIKFEVLRAWLKEEGDTRATREWRALMIPKRRGRGMSRVEKHTLYQYLGRDWLNKFDEDYSWRRKKHEKEQAKKARAAKRNK